MNAVHMLADGKNPSLGNSLAQMPEFAAFRDNLPEISPPHPALAPLMLRHEAEAAWLMARGVNPALARAAAARAAAQFCMAELEALPNAARALLPHWLAPMAAEVSPGPLRLSELFGLEAGAAERLHESWGLLGTADALMETGGDIRLARDPKTALNGYGCSHRPRPWAITFASSTASSSSERGYIAADKARLAATAALLRGTQGRKIVAGCIGAVRRGITRAFGLRAGEEIVLAASGTDTELLALALTHLAGTDKPVQNILIAPEETGRGVPMAARGLHFAVDTALGHDVTFEAPIEGFRPDTALTNILLRAPSGAVRPEAEVEAEIEAALAGALAAGKRVILHGLDLSKTGLLAPSPAFLAKLRAGLWRGVRYRAGCLPGAALTRFRAGLSRSRRHGAGHRLEILHRPAFRRGGAAARPRSRRGCKRAGCPPGLRPISTGPNSLPMHRRPACCRRVAITASRCAGTRLWRRYGRCCAPLRRGGRRSCMVSPRRWGAGSRLRRG